MLKPGDAAPDFSLKDGDGNDVRLSHFAGRPVLVYFYPKDNTPGCVVEAKGFRDRYEAIQAAGATVLGISMDTPESHCAMRDRLQLPFPLLSDPEGVVHDQYGAWRTALFGRSHLAVRRCSFLVDEAGVVRRVYRRINPLTHAKEAVEDLQELTGHPAAQQRPRRLVDAPLKPT